jgi:hypothetical protein
MKRFFVLMGLISAVSIGGALPAFATGPFDPETEVTTFLADVISQGWPIFLAIVGGLVAITLAAAGIRTVFRKVVKMLGRA